MLQNPLSVTQAAIIKTATAMGKRDHDSDAVFPCKGTGDLMVQMTRVSDNS